MFSWQKKHDVISCGYFTTHFRWVKESHPLSEVKFSKWIRAISGYLTTVKKRRFYTVYLHWFKNTLKEKKLSVCSPSCGMKERQHSIIEGDIRFSHEELVKVISITDYLVAKLRARAITRRTNEQCTTVSPYADWIISCPWGISEQTEARKLVSKAPLTTLSK